MQNKNFEKELPCGYKEARHIDARDVKFGLIFNLIALAVTGAVLVIAVLTLSLRDALPATMPLWQRLLSFAVFLLAVVAYIILHELVHGIAYKAATGEKLTYGISWSCAFCGVPHVFVYRKTAILALIAPLAVFTALLLPLMVWMYFVHPLPYLLSAFLFGLHLGGCSGDIYVLLLLLFRYRHKRLLLKDTGPEQFFYLPGASDA